VALTRTSLRLGAVPPFSFAESLRFLAAFPPLQDDFRIVAGELRQAVRVAGRTVGFRLSDGGSSAEPALVGEALCAAPLDAAAHAAVVDRLRFYLGLDDDLQPFHALAADDPPFAAVVERRFGFHHVKFTTPFEHACWAILGQRTPFTVACARKAALVAHGDQAVTIAGETYRAFPDAAQLASWAEPDVAALVRNARHAHALVATARAFADVDEQFLRTGDRAMVEQWLRAIPGIGPWSASFILVRGLGRMDTPSIVQPELQRAVEHVYGAPKSAVEIQQLAARYGAWQGYWALYLRNAD
jgi:DNA-3-methyladenine glycosylase II